MLNVQNKRRIKIVWAGKRILGDVEHGCWWVEINSRLHGAQSQIVNQKT